jgi:hypothetical protein
MADVVTPLGADDFDYSLSTSGDLAGSFLNQVEFALGQSNSHLVILYISTLDLKSGMISVISTSQGAQSRRWTMLFVAACLAHLTGGTLRAWTHRS